MLCMHAQFSDFGIVLIALLRFPSEHGLQVPLSSKAVDNRKFHTVYTTVCIADLV